MNRKLKIENHDSLLGSISRGADRFARAKWDEREAEDRRKEVGSVLLPLMLDEQVTKQKVDLGPRTATVRVKTRHKMDIDSERLKKAIGANQFNKLTSPVLDEAKVEAAIQLGELDPNVVAACTEESETPYLEARFKEKK